MSQRIIINEFSIALERKRRKEFYSLLFNQTEKNLWFWLKFLILIYFFFHFNFEIKIIECDEIKTRMILFPYTTFKTNHSDKIERKGKKINKIKSKSKDWSINVRRVWRRTDGCKIWSEKLLEKGVERGVLKLMSFKFVSFHFFFKYICIDFNLFFQWNILSVPFFLKSLKTWWKFWGWKKNSIFS